MNVERRQDRFDPQGYLRTTPKMVSIVLCLNLRFWNFCIKQDLKKKGEKKMKENEKKD